MAEVTKKKRTCALRSAPEEERKGDGTSAEQEPEAGPAPEGDVPPRAGRKGRGSRKERAEPEGTPRQATGRAPRCVKKAGALAGADSFEAALRVLIGMPLEQVNALEGVSARVAVCRTMIVKAAGGEKSAADWVRDTLGEKPADREKFQNVESVKVILFGEG